MPLAHTHAPTSGFLLLACRSAEPNNNRFPQNVPDLAVVPMSDDVRTACWNSSADGGHRADFADPVPLFCGTMAVNQYNVDNVSLGHGHPLGVGDINENIVSVIY
eukprot:3524711-Rhodomonas_salina.3